MTIKDCISKIYPSLTAVINGAVVKPEEVLFPDGTVGLKFPCPYCMDRQKRLSKTKEKCARIFLGAITPAGFRPYKFQCSRCTKKSISIHQFLKDGFPVVYQEYQRVRQAKNVNYKPDFN